jgi:hypothetical protein
VNRAFTFLDDPDPEGLDGVGRFFPQGDDLIIRQLRFPIEEGPKFLEGPGREESSSRPVFIEPLNADVAQGTTIGQTEAVVVGE